MSNSQAALMVADRIVSRLFDHRQFTAGQIDYLIKGIESNANLDETLNKMLKMNENVCLLLDESTKDGIESDNDLAKKATQQISTLIERAEGLLKTEKEFREEEKIRLAGAREERDLLMQDKARRVNLKLEKLEEGIMAEELELERKYLKLEENLRKVSGGFI